MEPVDRALVRVRGWIVAAFVLQSVVGTVIAFDVIEVMKRSGAYGDALASHDTTVTMAWTIAVLLGVLLLLLWLFQQLRRRQAWARAVLLVVGWISAASAAVNVLSAPLSGVVIERFVPAAVRGALATGSVLSLLANVVALAAWAYLIWTLQFRDDVRAAFRPCVPPASTTRSPSH